MYIRRRARKRSPKCRAKATADERQQSDDIERRREDWQEDIDASKRRGRDLSADRLENQKPEQLGEQNASSELGRDTRDIACHKKCGKIDFNCCAGADC